jgi:hypothetical protein
LDRPSESFHGYQEASSINNNQTEDNVIDIETNTSISHANEIIAMLTQKPNN